MDVCDDHLSQNPDDKEIGYSNVLSGAGLTLLAVLAYSSLYLAVLVILAIQLFAIQQCSIASTELCELVLYDDDDDDMM